MTDQYSEDPSVSGMLRSRSLARQSGEYPTPPQREEMTRALPDYETRDPNELAMLRHREMVRPLAGRADVPIEHVANVANVGASILPGMAIAKGIQAAPKITTGLGVLYGLLAGTDKGESGPDPAVDKDLLAKQQAWAAKGWYKKKPDGLPGTETNNAMRLQEDFDAQRAEEDRKQKIRDRELGAQEGANAATTETARANKAKADADAERIRQKAIEDERTAARKTAGDERMRDIEKNISPMSRAIRDYSSPIGMGLGIIAGAAGRGVGMWLNNRANKAAAAAGKEIMDAPAVGKNAVEEGIARAARANEFWRAGGAKEVPFTMTSKAPLGFSENPNVTPLGKTYNPNIHPMTEATVGLAPLADSAYSEYKLHELAPQMAEVQKAIEQDPSEANIQHLQKLKDNEALFQGMSRGGQVWGTAHGIGAVGQRFAKGGVRPNMTAAETEQGQLQNMLREQAEKMTKAQALKAAKAAKAANKPALGAPANPPQQVGVPPAATGPAATKARTLHSY